jgi:hypothetical protein
MTKYVCETCGRYLDRAPDGSWVVGEDVICSYDDPEKRRHVPREFDDGVPEPRGVNITDVGSDGVIEGFSNGTTPEGYQHVTLFYRRLDGDRVKTTVYLGYMDWVTPSTYRVRGVGDWAYVDVRVPHNEVPSAVKMLYTAYQIEFLMVTTDEGDE